MTAGPHGVTVVIPAYNAAAFLADALSSVAAQTRPADEVIVVDDASTDDTVAVAEQWLDRLPLRILRLERNSGPGVARQVAVDAASAPYIANLDADDRWLPDHLVTVMALAAPDTIVAARCRRQRSDGSGGVSEEPRSIPERDTQPIEILRGNFLFSGSVYPAAPLRDPAVGHATLRRAEDWDTWIRLIVLAELRALLSPHATVIKISRAEAVSVAPNYISGEVELYDALLTDARYARWHDELRTYQRRRRARSMMIDAARLAESGQSMRARRMFFDAARTDRSFVGGRDPAARGSVLLRSLVGMLWPGGFVRWRAQRAAAAGVITGGG